jgi:hypothetical protein
VVYVSHSSLRCRSESPGSEWLVIQEFLESIHTSRLPVPDLISMRTLRSRDN